MSDSTHTLPSKERQAKSRVDRVYEYLLERIISGEIRYGDTISIKKVAAELSVSSMPVREAVKRLEFEGVVTIKPRSACKVRVPSRRMILEVYQLREAMETYAVTSFGGSVKPEAMSRMRGIVEQMRLCAAEPDTSVREHKAIALDRQFHEQIISLASNEMLDSFSRQLSLHVNMTLMHEKTYHALESDWAEMHASILDQLPQHPQKAVELLRTQFAQATQLWLANGHTESNGG